MDARAAAVARFQASCQRDEQVVAAFLGGSLAAGTADAASDVDIYAVTQESDYAAFFARHDAFLRSWGRPVFVAATRDFEGLGFDMLHFVLDDGVHGELALGHSGNFRRLHGGPHQTLVDKVGLLDGVVFPRLEPSEAERRQQAEHALGWFWLDVMQLAKHVRRRHRLAAAEQLVRLRGHCSRLLDVARAVQVDADLQTVADRLASTTAMCDLADAQRAALAMAELHREVGELVAARLDLSYPDALAAVALGVLGGFAPY